MTMTPTIGGLFELHLLESLFGLVCISVLKPSLRTIVTTSHGQSLLSTQKHITIRHTFIMFRHVKEARINSILSVELCEKDIPIFSSQLFLDILKASSRTSSRNPFLDQGHYRVN